MGGHSPAAARSSVSALVSEASKSIGRPKTEELQTDSDRPLRPIPLIPDFAACLIEGQNGAGKSLAVRLLQLATGDQPYGATPRAWDSLRDGLGDVRVVASKLEGAERIEWLFGQPIGR